MAGNLEYPKDDSFERYVQHREEFATLKSEFHGMRLQQQQHNVETRTSIAELSRKIDNSNGKIDQLFETMNRGKGAYSFALLVSAFIGGIIVKVGGFFIGK